MHELNHPSIIRLHEVYETQNSLYMVFDLLKGGSLYDKIKVAFCLLYILLASANFQSSGNLNLN